MKKIILFICFLVCSVFLVAQTGTGWEQIRKKENFKDSVSTAKLVEIRGGVMIGDRHSNTSIRLDSVSINADDQIVVYNNAIPNDTAGLYIRKVDQIDADLVYVKLLPDTVNKTDAFTLSLTEVNAEVYCNKATAVIITIPANVSVAIPIGTTINFIQAGAGKLVFKEAANVNMYSKLDSIATSSQWGWAALKKRGTNNWLLYGDISD